jgi:hypothetical protein
LLCDAVFGKLEVAFPRYVEKVDWRSGLMYACNDYIYLNYFVNALFLPKYMVMSRDRIAGRGEGVKIDNRSIERVKVFKYLGATLTDKNSKQEEIKSRLKLGNACYYSVQNIFCLPGCYPET